MKRQGLSLIEMLVSMGIIAIIATIAIFNFRDVRKIDDQLTPSRVAEFVRSLPHIAAARKISLVLYHDSNSNSIRVRTVDGEEIGPPYILQLSKNTVVSPAGATWLTIDKNGLITVHNHFVIGSKQITVSRWGDVRVQ